MRFIKHLILAILFLTLSNKYTAQNLALDSTLGYKNAQTVAAEMILYEDVAKTAYISSVGNRLVANLEDPLFDYQFHIIADPIPNAFALPGGYIYITTGLIILLQNEDELACILGHEIIHSNNRHAIKQIKKSILPKMLEIPGALIGLVTPTLGYIINIPFKGINSVIFASYSKSSENEADKLGTKLAAKAGYNPLELNPILDRLAVNSEMISGEEEKDSYLSSHPYTPKRVKRITKNAKKISWTATPPTSNNIIKEFDGILVGNSPEMGMIKENHFLHPLLNFKIDFPKGWKTENTTEAVGAYTEDKKGLMAITIADSNLSPEVAAKKYISKLQEQEKTMISSSEKMTINGLEAYLIVLKEKKGQESANAYITWVQLDSIMINITGLTISKYSPLVYAAIKSINSLNDNDRSTITYKSLKIVTSKKDETVTSISKRTKNVLTPALTSLINAINIEEKLTEEKQFKIAIELPYIIKK